jgi:hypothetical protein
MTVSASFGIVIVGQGMPPVSWLQRFGKRRSLLKS